MSRHTKQTRAHLDALMAAIGNVDDLIGVLQKSRWPMMAAAIAAAGRFLDGLSPHFSRIMRGLLAVCALLLVVQSQATYFFLEPGTLPRLFMRALFRRCCIYKLFSLSGINASSNFSRLCARDLDYICHRRDQVLY